MSQILATIQALLKRGEYLVSRHGYRELAADDIVLDEILAGVGAAVIVEDYPDPRREPSGLVYSAIRRPRNSGFPKIDGTPAVPVTAYRPARDRWSPDFTKRKKP